MHIKTIVSMLDSVRLATSFIMIEVARVAKTSKELKDGSGVLAHVRLAINKVEQQSIQDLADTFEPRRPVVTRSDLEPQVLDAIMNGTTWRSAAEIGRELNPEAANPHAAASRWLANKQIFAIDHRGKKMFPAYVFSDSWTPIPEVKKILTILADYSALRLASWFESSNPALRGMRPREVMKLDAKAVLKAAERHVVGAVHG